jgi:hypothetical protein
MEFKNELAGGESELSIFDAAEGFPRHLDPWNWC